MIGVFEKYELTFGSFGQQYTTIGGRQYITFFDLTDPHLRGLQCGVEIEFAHLQLPAADFIYRYRLIATIALAEISRQTGRRQPAKMPTGPRPPIYDQTLGALAAAKGELVRLEELLAY